MKTITLSDARARLSAVIDDALAGEPSLIVRNGRKEAVVLSFEEYQRLASVSSFGRLLAAFPGETDDLPMRLRVPMRDAF